MSSRFLFGATALAICVTQARANVSAVWDTYPKLLCTYDLAQICSPDLSSCSPIKGGAILRFDFRSNEIKVINADDRRMITGKYHFNSGTMEAYSPDVNAVLSEGTLYSFIKVTKGSIGNADSIDGVAQTADARSGAFAVHMACHPDAPD